MPLTLTVTSVDHAPAELHDQTPFDVELIREFPGPDRPDYWLASARNPLWWLVDNHKTPITHLVIAARWTDTKIEPGIEDMPIGISFVADPSVLRDAELDFSKVRYAAIGHGHGHLWRRAARARWSDKDWSYRPGVWDGDGFDMIWAYGRQRLGAIGVIA